MLKQLIFLSFRLNSPTLISLRPSFALDLEQPLTAGDEIEMLISNTYRKEGWPLINAPFDVVTWNLHSRSPGGGRDHKGLVSEGCQGAVKVKDLLETNNAIWITVMEIICKLENCSNGISKTSLTTIWVNGKRIVSWILFQQWIHEMKFNSCWGNYLSWCFSKSGQPPVTIRQSKVLQKCVSPSKKEYECKSRGS